MMLPLLLIVPLLLTCVEAQENGGTSVANSLIPCYNTSEYLDRQRRPPATMNVLIDIIRKVEDGKSAQDARQLAYELIHRFRQDGIVKSSPSTNSIYTLSFSPTGMQRSKNRILLRDFIPGNAFNFPNETLSLTEQCAFHFMISNTVLEAKRGDEGQVCSNIGRYVSRAKRSDDAEILEPAMRTPKLTHNEELSECPLEYGAVYTKWGTIQAGTVLAGIAAGLEKQSINVDGLNSDSRYAATLAGDLTEAALYESKTIGRKGSWNNTQVPRYYFIEKEPESNYQFTDAEVRAGLDGLNLAMHVESWKNKVSGLKISQILDMYYSLRGVFSSKIRACNRLGVYSNVTTVDELKLQTIIFARYYDKKTSLPVTINEEGLKKFSEEKVDSFIQYLNQMSDLSCVVDDSKVERAGTDLIIVLDTLWDYNSLLSALSFLLDNLDINKYGSNVTIINGNDGRTILPSTNTILDFHAIYNLTTHQSHPTGFLFEKIFSKIEALVKERVEEDKKNNVMGGRSTILLLLPQGTPSSTDNEVMNDMKNKFKVYLPDFKILVLGQGSKDAYSGAVTNPTYDIFTLSETTDGTSITGAIKPLINRIKEIPRKIVNPSCGTSWSGNSNSKSMDQYVEPNTINYYKLSPQYFYGEGERYLKIRGQGYGQITVCSSRDNVNPSFSDDPNSCKNLNTDEYSIPLNNICADSKYISECRPLYISVNATQITDVSTNYRCTDKNCRFPDNIKFIITAEGLGCASGSTHILASLFLVSIAAVAAQLRVL